MIEDAMPEITWPNNHVASLFGVRHPIVQAGMVWTAGWKLCVAVARSGCFGQIGAGSMKPDLLREHIQKARTALDKIPFGVNVPMERADASELIDVCIQEQVKAVFTSAGNPGVFTEKLKKNGIVVVHVTPSARLAKKCEERGVDAVVCEGTEAGGHNGYDEISTFTLIPQVREAVKIPVIAAGGIVNGRGIAAAFALGADGVQIGTRFAATVESSSSDRYKQAVVEAGESDTVLSLKNLIPTRMIKSPFSMKAVEFEKRGATTDENRELLSHKRERLGIFEGNWEEGQFEAGMGSGMIHDIPPASEVVDRLLKDYQIAVNRLTAKS